MGLCIKNQIVKKIINFFRISLNVLFFAILFDLYPRMPMNKVIVIGGGVAGMSAAHELIERNFEVEIYEK